MSPLRALLAVGVAALGLTACERAALVVPDFWIQDLERGVEVALETGRPMLVVFR